MWRKYQTGFSWITISIWSAWEKIIGHMEISHRLYPRWTIFRHIGTRRHIRNLVSVLSFIAFLSIFGWQVNGKMCSERLQMLFQITFINYYCSKDMSYMKNNYTQNWRPTWYSRRHSTLSGIRSSYLRQNSMNWRVDGYKPLSC